MYRKASNLRIVIPEKIIVQACLADSVLPGVAQGLMGEGGNLRQSGDAVGLVSDFTKTTVLTAPAYQTIFVGYIQRRAVQVGVKPVNE